MKINIKCDEPYCDEIHAGEAEYEVWICHKVLEKLYRKMTKGY